MNEIEKGLREFQKKLFIKLLIGAFIVIGIITLSIYFAGDPADMMGQHENFNRP